MDRPVTFCVGGRKSTQNEIKALHTCYFRIKSCGHVDNMRRDMGRLTQGCEFPSARPVIAVSSAPWTAKATGLCNTQLAMKAILSPRSNIFKKTS